MAAGAVDVNLALGDLTAATLAAAAAQAAAHGLTSAWVTDGAADSLPDVPAGLAVVPTLVPPTGTPGALARAERIAADAGVRVVRLSPTAGGYPLLDWVVRPLPELCARERMAMLLDFSPLPPPWREVVELARAQPALPVVVVAGAMSAYTVPAALDATANVLVDVSGHASLAELAPTFGLHRFVWGSAGSPARMRDERGVAERLAGNAAALAAGTYAETFL